MALMNDINWDSASWDEQPWLRLGYDGDERHQLKSASYDNNID